MHRWTPAWTESERERLILEHLNQVHLIARRIHERLPSHIAIEDLVSNGIVGLIAAVDKFDPSRNLQLKTYAEHRIRGAIFDSLRGQDWASRHLRKKARQIESAIEASKRRLQREPAEEEIAEELHLSLEEYQKWLNDVQCVDLDPLETATDGHGVELLKLVSDSDEKLPSRLFERSELESIVADAVDRMPQVERTVLGLYFQEELNLREIAEILKLHVSRVSQLKTQAILRLRGYMERRLTPPARGVPGAAEAPRPAR